MLEICQILFTLVIGQGLYERKFLIFRKSIFNIIYKIGAIPRTRLFFRILGTCRTQRILNSTRLKIVGTSLDSTLKNYTRPTL